MPITLIVPFPPGGPTDLVARRLAEVMAPALGQSIVVENVGGAGGSLGMARLARAKPDGHTVGLGTNGTQTINPALYTSLQYDPVRDFASLSLLNRYANVLVVASSRGIRSIRELVDYAKSNPARATFASSGIGASNHLAGEMFKSATGAPLVHVPYKGSAPAIIDVLNGTVLCMFDAMPTIQSHVRAGTLLPIGYAGSERSPLLPDLPAIAEAIPGFSVPNWMALFAPAGTPASVVGRLNEAIVLATRSEPILKLSSGLGFESVSSTPAELDAVVSKDMQRFGTVVRSLGLKI